MSHRDAEELAAEIAYMQDDPSFHPRYNPKGKKDTNDLEARIEGWSLGTRSYINLTVN